MLMEMSNQSKDKREACHHILGYLVDHPDAGDTLDGIAEWWLLHQKIRFETRTVSRAVAQLVAQDLIVEQKGPDGRLIYRANRSWEKTQAMLGQMRALSDDESN
jgi:hypothetical protein